MTCDPAGLASRRGLLGRRRFLVLLWAAALLAPVAYLPRAVLAPASRIPCGRPEPNHLLGDPVIALSVMGRAWSRWDAGDLRRRDDRVLAPYPDAWALGEQYTLAALVGYPIARASGSLALGYNVPYVLGWSLTLVGTGILLAELAGPGWIALGGALLFTFGPARLNNLGVIGTVWSGLVPLALHATLRFLRRGGASRLAGAFGAWIALGLSSLYGTAMGAVVAALLLAFVAGESRARRRLPALAGALSLSALAVAWFHAPYFKVAEETGAIVDRAAIEGHAADVLSLLHEGVFSGPLRTLLDRLVPGLPEGAAAFFPTLTASAALGLGALLLGRGGGTSRPRAHRRVLPWLAIAATAFLLALGPTIRLAGRPVGPGPSALLMRLPVFGTLRGIHRWDQWFDLGLVAAGALAAGRLLRSRRRRTSPALLALLSPLLLLDVWPRAVPAQEVPGASPFDGRLRALPRDAVVAVYPYTRATAERAWAEQLHHGRRCLTGFWAVAPPLHAWLGNVSRGRPLEETLAIFHELGARAVDIRAADLDEAGRVGLEAVLSQPGRSGVVEAVARDGRALLLLEPREPVLVDPARLEALVFEGRSATVGSAAGRLLFRLRGPDVPVRLESGTAVTPATLTVPLVAAGRMRATLGVTPPPGVRVVNRRDGRTIGIVSAAGPP